MFRAVACRPGRHWAWMRRETTGRATEPIHRMPLATSAEDPTVLIISVLGPFFHSRIRDRRLVTCPTVFKAHHRDQTHRNIRHRQHLQDRPHPGQVHHRQAFHHHLKIHQALLTMDQLEAVPLDHLRVTDHSSADQAAQDQLSGHSSAPAVPTTLAEALPSWVLPAHHFTAKDIRWADPVT